MASISIKPEAMAVWFSFLFYVAHVLVPIIPAAIIYRMFPSDKIGVKGVLQGLKINATGAFAAYIIVFLLGMFTVNRTLCLISGMTKQSWEVRAPVRFVDKDRRDLKGLDMEKVVQAVCSGAAGSWAMNNRSGNMIRR